MLFRSKAGSPTDSLEVATIIRNAGVSSDVVKQVYSNMKIPAPGEQGGGSSIERKIDVDPSSLAPSLSKPTEPSAPAATEPSVSTSTASTEKAPVQTSEYQQVKQLLTQLDKRGKMNLVKMLDKELAVTEGILALSEEEILAELSPETLASYKDRKSTRLNSSH